MEEVGLKVKIHEIVYETSNYDQTKDKVFTTLFYTCGVLGKKKIVLDPEEHDDYKWVTLEELCAMDDTDLVPYMKRLAQTMQKHIATQDSKI